MPRFNANDVDKYGGQGGGGYFSLKDDGDTARIRFMYNGIDDVEGYAVHEVEVDGKKRYVNCLREYGAPVDDCPFCRERMYQTAKLFIPVYDIENDKTLIWERGKKFFAKLSSQIARYPEFVSHIFEVERVGRKGDTSTTYELYEIEKDNTRLSDLPELPKVLGGIVMDKSADDMEAYLATGQFPPSDDDEPQIRRRSTVSERRRADRRTPATSGRERNAF